MDRYLDGPRDGTSPRKRPVGTTTIKDTVGQALRLAVADREEGLERALDVLIEVPLVDRSEAWR